MIYIVIYIYIVNLWMIHLPSDSLVDNVHGFFRFVSSQALPVPFPVPNSCLVQPFAIIECVGRWFGRKASSSLCNGSTVQICSYYYDLLLLWSVIIMINFQSNLSKLLKVLLSRHVIGPWFWLAEVYLSLPYCCDVLLKPIDAIVQWCSRSIDCILILLMKQRIHTHWNNWCDFVLIFTTNYLLYIICFVKPSFYSRACILGPVFEYVIIIRF